MTNKEAKTIMEKLLFFYRPLGGSVEAWNMAIKALEKADKYRWHDLRKNPDDLPVKAEYVEVITDEHDDIPLSIQYDDAIMQFGERRISLGYVDSVFIEWDAERRGKIIAWRYIEPFKEEEECVSD